MFKRHGCALQLLLTTGSVRGHPGAGRPPLQCRLLAALSASASARAQPAHCWPAASWLGLPCHGLWYARSLGDWNSSSWQCTAFSVGLLEYVQWTAAFNTGAAGCTFRPQHHVVQQVHKRTDIPRRHPRLSAAGQHQALLAPTSSQHTVHPHRHSASVGHFSIYLQTWRMACPVHILQMGSA